jgi:hypothetical protein
MIGTSRFKGYIFLRYRYMGHGGVNHARHDVDRSRRHADRSYLTTTLGHFAEHLGRCYDGLWVGTERDDIPQARRWGPGAVERRSPVTPEQAGTLRDAMALGVALEVFHRESSCRRTRLRLWYFRFPEGNSNL